MGVGVNGSETIGVEEVSSLGKRERLVLYN
jgi:hypothetical protein